MRTDLWPGVVSIESPLNIICICLNCTLGAMTLYGPSLSTEINGGGFAYNSANST
jgi:hypothetical protein